MADSTNPSLGGHVIQWYYLWVIPKITGGPRVIAPFTYPDLDFDQTESEGVDLCEILEENSVLSIDEPLIDLATDQT